MKASLQVLRYVRKKNPRICRRKREEGGDGVGKVDVYTRSTLVFGGEVFRGFTPHAFRALPKGPDRVGTQEAVRAGRRDQYGGARRVGENLGGGGALDIDPLTPKVRLGGMRLPLCDLSGESPAPAHDDDGSRRV